MVLYQRWNMGKNIKNEKEICNLLNNHFATMGKKIGDTICDLCNPPVHMDGTLTLFFSNNMNNVVYPMYP